MQSGWNRVLQRVMPRDWHHAVASLALIIFAFQSYVTQTHVHLLWHGAPNAAIQASNGQTQLHRTPAPNQKNPFDDPATCPICQDMALVGHFTMPAIIPVPPPAFLAIASETFLALPVIVPRPSHDWHGRAPPQH